MLQGAKDREKVQERLSKLSLKVLDGTLDVLDLPRGQKEEGKKVTGDCDSSALSSWQAEGAPELTGMCTGGPLQSLCL